MNKVKRYSLTELALLAVFVVGLLMAHLIVKLRSRVVLSDLVLLPGFGLSVSVPAGPGWGRTAAWQYEDTENSMMLISKLGVPGRRGMVARWRFVFSSPDGSEQELLERKAGEISAVIQSFNTIDQDCPMVYARMLLPQSPREGIYLGIMRMGHNRSLELLVSSTGLGADYGENVLKSLAGSIQYQPGRELSDGRVRMDEFLETQIGRLSSRSLPDEAFLIKDMAGGNLGYYHARHSVSEKEQRAFRTQVRQFEYKALKLESELWFDPQERSYRWQTDQSNPRVEGTLTYEIAPGESGGLVVTRNKVEQKVFPPGRFFLPELLLVELASEFLQSHYSSVTIDVLGARGQMAPVCLTKISPAEATAKAEAVESVVRMDFLYHPDSYEELLFDQSQNLLGKLMQQPGRKVQIWDVVSADTLEQIFEEDF